MARTSQKKKAGQNKQLWDRANTSHRIKWETTSQQGYDFYLNEQLSANELNSLEEAGMPTFTINRITPIIETMRYFTTANNPKWKAVGLEGSDTDIAHIHSQIADYCWINSNGKSLYGQVILDSLTKGIGYFFVDIDKDSDLGLGDVVFSRIEPYDVFVDPVSRDSLFRDASFITVKKNLSKTQLLNMFPEYSAKINKVATNSSAVSYSVRSLDESSNIQPSDVTNTVTPEGEDDQIIDYYEVYRKIKVPFVNVFVKIPPTPKEVKKITQDVDIAIKEMTAELVVMLKEQEASLNAQVESGQVLPERAKLEMEKAKRKMEKTLIEKRKMLVSQSIEKATQTTQQSMTVDEYNIIIKNKAFANSITDVVKYAQFRIEVSVSLSDDTLLHEYILPIEHYPIIPVPYTYTGTPYPMSAVLPMVGKQQEINKAHQIMLHNANLASNLRWMYQEGSVPESEWEKYSSSPGALLKYRQGFDPPTAILPAPINNAFFSVVQEGKSDAEYIAGIPSSMMGFVQQQPETYRGLLANDEFGTRRLRAWMNNTVEPSLTHLGRVFKDVAQETYTADRVFRIVQPEAGQDPSEVDEKEVRINIPIYNDYGKAIGKWRDYGASRFDVVLVAGSTMPVNRWAMIEEYFRWFQAGLIDDIAMLSETDIRGKKNIVKRKSMYAKMQGQSQKLVKALKDRDGTIETLQRQLVQAGIRHKIDVADKEIYKEVADTEAQQKLYKNLIKKDFEHERENVQKDIDRITESAKK